MSHSQFRRVKTYTETCMDESLRQAYDYWQDQPGFCYPTEISGADSMENVFFVNKEKIAKPAEADFATKS